MVLLRNVILGIFFFILLIVLIMFVLYFILPKIQFLIFQNKYNQATYLNSKENCYSGWVNNDFDQTFTSPSGFSFKYPKYLYLSKNQPQKYEDKTDHSVQITEPSLETKHNIFFNPQIRLSVQTHQNTKNYPQIRGDKAKVPCGLISQVDYRNYSGQVLGSRIYGTVVDVIFPPNASNYKYLTIGCNDGDQNKSCNLILPQLLSTLQFK